MSGDELVIEADDCTEDRAERIVAVEERLEERHREAEGGADVQRVVDLTPNAVTEDAARRARVVDIEDDNHECRFTVVDRGVKREFAVSFPNDTTDSTAELVSGCATGRASQ